jgi:hypothetical protein
VTNESDNQASNNERSNLEKISLSSSAVRKLVATRIQEDIEKWSIDTYKEDYRTHLGASTIGENCMQKLWLRFHWAKDEVKSGRVYRLLNRGNLEEPNLFAMLRAIGFQVLEIDPNTGKQYRMSGVMGHYGGSLDAIAYFPASYNIAEPTLISCKTQGTGSAFKNLTDNGVVVEKPLFYDQENAYGHAYGLDYATWFVVNKNDDTWHIETVPINHQRGEQLKIKAEKIITSRVEMTKIAKSATFKECSYCEMKGICFKEELPDRNCRSCKHSFATENKEWYCEVHKDIIPKHIIPQTCGDSYSPIVNGND